MAVPSKKLELKEIDFSNLSLADLVVFTPGALEGVHGLLTLRQWLIDNVDNWTTEEVNRIRLNDLAEVAEMIAEEVDKQAVPLEK